eukprot:COSAG02_NODE_5693_length_4119_cov_2.287562_4_plen_47_part_00
MNAIIAIIAGHVASPTTVAPFLVIASLLNLTGSHERTRTPSIRGPL